MDKVRWGIIGVGDVSEVKSGPAFNLVDNSELISVMRRNLEKAKDYALRHNIPNYTNNAEDILYNSEINAVYIATPPSSHCEYAIEAAQAKKHVYVEKPMAITFEECMKMVKAAEENNVKLFVAYYRRELDYFKKVKELIDNNSIGEIKFVDIKLLLPPNKDDYNKENLPWRVKKDIAGGGYFFDFASHQFDFLDYLLGPIKLAKGVSTNQNNLYGVEDIVSASFKFDNNILGTGLWCFTMDESKRFDRTTIIGTNGKIEFSFFNPKPIILSTFNSTGEFTINFPKHIQQQLIEKVVESIIHNKEHHCNGKIASRANKILEAILNG